MYHGMNDPFRVGLLASSEEDERMDMITYPVLFSNIFLFVTLSIPTDTYTFISFKIPLKLPEELKM